MPPTDQTTEELRFRLLDPRSIVLDLVLEWAEKIGEQGTAKITRHELRHAEEAPVEVVWSMVMFVRNHRDEKLQLGAVIHFDDAPKDGVEPRFVLRKLAATVWKLSPSILQPNFHGYVTLVGVPDPAPWEG